MFTRRIIEDWWQQRIPLARLNFADLSKEEVPRHRYTFLYYLGGLSLALMIAQVITGLMLLIYYKPNVSEAYQSVQTLVRGVPFGSEIRNLHVWISQALVIVVCLHAFTVALTKSFRRPRELTWMTGFLSLVLVMAFCFTGYLLPWNTVSVYATKIALEIGQNSTAFLPGILAGTGDFMVGLIFGSNQIGPIVLERSYWLHILILPLFLLLVLGSHLLLVRLHGVSVPESQLEGTSFNGKYEPYFQGFALKEIAIATLLLTAILILAIVLPYDFLLPYTMTAPYDPLLPAPSGIKPEWYFNSLYYLLMIVPLPVVVVLLSFGLLLVLILPWLNMAIYKLCNRAIKEPTMASKYASGLVSFCIACWFGWLVALTFFGPGVVTMFTGKGGH
jgi:cytochrome b6